MFLNNKDIILNNQWKECGYSLPKYNRSKVTEETMKNPFWLHFGAGNIFKAFQANVVENMLNAGQLDRGLVVVEGYDYEIINEVSKKNDDLSILVTLKADGTMEKTVVGSVVESLVLDSYSYNDFTRLKDIFSNPSLQMVSFTITEKGYSLVDGKGEMVPSVKADIEGGVEMPQSYMGKVTALLYQRFTAGKLAIAMVSMDNCSHNGDKLKAAVVGIAEGWVKNGKASQDFVDYLNNKSLVSFPWTMIDKITPRPHDSVQAMLQADGIEKIAPVVTSMNTFVAPFVNAEECEYLVIEDDFPNGREALEKGGIYFTDRETVNKVEKMKVCTCLNPLHTALAIYGCLLGYDKISDQMENPALKSMVKTLGYTEGMKVVVDPKILSPMEFIDQVVEKRIPNPFMPDTPQRIATDTSQKLAIRFGETIKAYSASSELDVNDLQIIPLILAGWVRYLMAVDDKGNSFPLSADPMLSQLQPIVDKLQLGSNDNNSETLKKIFSNTAIFGVDLYEAGLGEKVEGFFAELNAGVGAVAATLNKYCV